MFERILLPLDGSELAEVAIPYAEELAGRLGSELHLLHVCDTAHEEYQHMHKIYIAEMTENIQLGIKKHWPRNGALVSGDALPGDPSEAICNYIKEKDISLVVMATHGLSGVTLWKLGSVADKVIRAVWVPTLLVRAGAPVPKEDRKISLFKRILVPLDGSDASKIALPFAEELGTKLKASISLFRMTRSSYTYAGMEGMAGTVSIDLTRIDRAEERRIRAYLGHIAEELRKEGIAVTYNTMLGTDPAHEIIELGKKAKADLVVMSTRGRSRLARWLIGSTAEKVLREGDLPLLLVRQAGL